jgi:hypothetical protein
MISTDAGREIEVRNTQERNTPLSIQERAEPGSKSTVKRWSQWEKQSEPMEATDDGMQIEESAWQSEKADSRIR